MQEGLALAGQDPVLFKHYWVNTSQMQKYFQIWMDRNAQVDLKSFFSVCSDAARYIQTSVPAGKLSLPIRIIFGKKDPLIAIKTELETAVQWLGDIDFEIYEESSHYPHLEEAERFILSLKSQKTESVK
jgi:pimeloyl-ACP methyl ester carboxylesterase